MAQAVPGVDLHPSIRVKLRGATLITRRGSLPWSQRVVSLTSEQAEATQRRSWRFPAIRETTRTSLFVAWRLAKIRRIGEKEKPLRWLTPAEATTLLTACRKSKNKALPDLVDSACSLACTEARRSR